MPTAGAPTPKVTALVLAAGASRRFGSPKLTAVLEGRPLLQHVLDRLATVGITDPVVVLAPEGGALDAAIDWRGAQQVINPDPGRGLTSSLRIGWAAALASAPPPDAVLVLLGDQPRVSADLVRALAAAPLDPAQPLLVPRYAGGGGGNPVRVEASAAAVLDEVEGDRGLGPVIARHPELVRWLDVDGTNPDVDTPTDLADLAALASRSAASDEPRP